MDLLPTADSDFPATAEWISPSAASASSPVREGQQIPAWAKLRPPTSGGG